MVIALALAPEPSLIIADEPTTALDVSVQAQILDLLKRLCRERGTSVILITHDMGVIAETTDRVAVLYAGRLAEIGRTSDVLKDPQHPYTNGLVAATPRIDPDSYEKSCFKSPAPCLTLNKFLKVVHFIRGVISPLCNASSNNHRCLKIVRHAG